MNNLKDKRAYIFDFDGVIIDSEPYWNMAHKEFFRKYNIQEDKSKTGDLHGAGLLDSIKLFKKVFGLSESYEDLLNDYREIFYKSAKDHGGFKMLVGTRELVDYLYENNYKLAIATGGHTVEGVRQVITDLDLDKYFSVLSSSDDVKLGKPEPDVYLHTADALKVDPKECVVIEDSINGVLSGNSANMTTIGVIDDKSYQDKLIQNGADFVVNNLHEIIDLIEK